jgi:hypothetical protein
MKERPARKVSRKWRLRSKRASLAVRVELSQAVRLPDWLRESKREVNSPKRKSGLQEISPEKRGLR